MSIRYGRLKTKAIVFAEARSDGRTRSTRRRDTPAHGEDSRRARRCARDGRTIAWAHLRRRHGGHQGRGTRVPGCRVSPRPGAPRCTVDVGTRAAPRFRPMLPPREVAAHHPGGAERGARPRRPRHRGRRDGRGLRRASSPPATTSAAIVGIGGGGGTSIVTAGMRALPIGVPKLMVSTLASGDVGALCRRLRHRDDARRSPTSPG